MGYTVVKSFERGIDTRRLIDTTEAGALLDGRDCHITLGGEIEKRAAFVVADTLPPETIGFYVTEGRVYHTWGDSPTPPVGLPAGTVYHYVYDPDDSPLERILSVEEFMGDLYVVAKFVDGHVYHFWKDTLLLIPPPEPVEDPDGGGPVTPPPSTPANKPQTTVMFFPAIYLSGTPPTHMHIYAIYLVAPSTTYNFGPTGTIDAFMLMPETGTSGGKPVGDITLDYSPGTLGAARIATAMMEAVNSFTTTPKVDAQAASGTPGQVLFWVDVPGTAYNGWKIEFKTSSMRIENPATPPYVFSGGVVVPPPPPGPPPPPPAPGGPIEVGTFALAHNKRIFSVSGTFLNFSATEDPATWFGSETTAGTIDHSTLANHAPNLISMGDYGGDLAVFGTRHIFVWHIEIGNPDGDTKKQALHGTGTFAAHSVVPYGASDVMYLDVSGVRSLRARDSSEQSFAADIGNLIDDLVRAKITSLTDDQKKYNVWGIVEPRSGRLWMALFDRIFVLTYYPSSRISAWTYYDATTAPVDYMVSSDNSVYWRSGDNIVIYGGEDGDEYDDTEALARVPYIDGGKPATLKNWTGIDLAILGTWAVRGSFDPTVPTAFDSLANLTKSTYAQQKIAINGESPALSLELKSTYIGPARIGNAALHFSDSTAD